MTLRVCIVVSKYKYLGNNLGSIPNVISMTTRCIAVKTFHRRIPQSFLYSADAKKSPFRVLSEFAEFFLLIDRHGSWHQTDRHLKSFSVSEMFHFFAFNTLPQKNIPIRFLCVSGVIRSKRLCSFECKSRNTNLLVDEV